MSQYIYNVIYIDGKREAFVLNSSIPISVGDCLDVDYLFVKVKRVIHDTKPRGVCLSEERTLEVIVTILYVEAI